jgi:hypothetical protein
LMGMGFCRKKYEIFLLAKSIPINPTISTFHKIDIFRIFTIN